MDPIDLWEFFEKWKKWINGRVAKVSRLLCMIGYSFRIEKVDSGDQSRTSINDLRFTDNQTIAFIRIVEEEITYFSYFRTITRNRFAVAMQR